MNEEQKEKALQFLNKTKRDAMKFYNDACKEMQKWEQIIEDCDAQIEDVSLMGEPKGTIRRKLLIVVAIINVLIFISIILCSCNAVQGVGRDIQWIGAAGQEMLQEGHKTMNK